MAYEKTTQGRNQFQLQVNSSNELIHPATQAGDPTAKFDTRELSTVFSGKGTAIFVMNPDGGIYCYYHKLGRFHHSTFLGGGESSGAGELRVTAGKLTWVSNKSGHYQPGFVQLYNTLVEFQTVLKQDLAGVDLFLFGLNVATKGPLEKAWPEKAITFVNGFAANPTRLYKKLGELGFLTPAKGE